MHGLTSASAWVGILTVATALWVSAASPACNYVLPRYLTQPGLAIELATSREEVEQILGAPTSSADREVVAEDRPRKETETRPNLCRQARAKLISMQGRDLVFIPFYVLFFALIGAQVFVLGSQQERAAGWWRLVGGAAIVAALSAGILDVQEDRIILACLQAPATCSIMPRPWAVAKWAAVFFVVLLNTPAFLLSRRTSSPQIKGTARWLAYIAAVLGAWAALTGLFALSLGDDHRLEDAAATLVPAMLVIWLAMAGLAWFPSGFGAALDRLATLPILSRLSEWPSDEEGQSQQVTPPLDRRPRP